MADQSYEEIAQAFKAERATYEKLIRESKQRLTERIQAEGIYATVTARVKEAENFAIKATLGDRYSDPLRQIGDKGGVRVIVPYLRDVDQVETLVREAFTVIKRDQKLEALAYNEVGYLGVHLDTRLRDEDAEELGEDLKGLRFEIQIRTVAQSAWAEVAHDQIYKPPADVPEQLKRRIYRLVSLVELFDNEVEGFLSEAARTPGYQEALALEPLAEALLKRFGVHRRPDRELSLTMAAAVVPLYESSVEAVVEHMQAWIRDNAEKLENIFASAATASAPLLLQPESFLVLERLESDPDRLVEAWPEAVPRSWLEEAALAWEVRIPDSESQDELPEGD